MGADTDAYVIAGRSNMDSRKLNLNHDSINELLAHVLAADETLLSPN